MDALYRFVPVVKVKRAEAEYEANIAGQVVGTGGIGAAS